MASKKKPDKSSVNTDFESLVTSMVRIHHEAQQFAAKAVNIGLTLRNWLIGRQIELYERKGLDRAAYGDKLMVALSERVAARGWTRCDRRELYRYRQFYITYPKIVETLSRLLPPRPQVPHPRRAEDPSLPPRKPRPAQYLRRLLQKALVEFAPGDLPNSLFVSNYAVEMPDKATMETSLKHLGKELGHDG